MRRVNWNLANCHATVQGVTPVEFRGDLWHQKTRVPELSYGVVCVILRLAVLAELRLVTDTYRHRETDRHRPMASTADAQHRAAKMNCMNFWHLYLSSLGLRFVLVVFVGCILSVCVCLLCGGRIKIVNNQHPCLHLLTSQVLLHSKDP